MNVRTHRITLDVDAPSSQAAVTLRQGENAHRFEIFLNRSTQPYRISEECHAVLAAAKSDGTQLLNACTIENDAIIYDLTAQTTAAPGRLDCEVRLYGAENKLLIAPRFAVYVEKSAIDESAVESSDEFSALNELILKAQGISGVCIKGYYPSAAELEKIPAPAAGDAYGIGVEPPYDLYVWDALNGVWVNNGALNGGSGGTGEKGDKGDTGADGVTPTIGDNGNWFLGDTDTGKPSRGEKGDKGDTGDKGANGTRGSRWFSGTAIGGTSTLPAVFPDSGISEALTGDRYLNTGSGNIYECTFAGNAAAAKWVYSGCIKGKDGGTSSGSGGGSDELWYPAVSAEGVVSWEKSASDTPPISVNIKGEKGDAFTYSDFTPEQLAALKGAKGDKGDTGDKGAKGDKGDTGDKGAKGDKGDTGADGITPTIGDNGNWFIGDTDTGKPSRGEKGDKGDKGDSGGGSGGDRIYIGAEPPTDEKYDIWLDTDEPALKIWYPAVSAEGVVSWEKSASDAPPAAVNIKGNAGAAGYTPVRGTDYWTAADKAEIVSATLAALPTWTGGSY